MTTARFPTINFGLAEKAVMPDGKTPIYIARFSVYNLGDDGETVYVEIHVYDQDATEHKARNEALAELSRRVSHLADRIKELEE